MRVRYVAVHRGLESKARGTRRRRAGARLYGNVVSGGRVRHGASRRSLESRCLERSRNAKTQRESRGEIAREGARKKDEGRENGERYSRLLSGRVGRRGRGFLGLTVQETARDVMVPLRSPAWSMGERYSVVSWIWKCTRGRLRYLRNHASE